MLSENTIPEPPIGITSKQCPLAFTRACLDWLRCAEHCVTADASAVVAPLLSIVDDWQAGASSARGEGKGSDVSVMAATGVVLALSRDQCERGQSARLLWQLIHPSLHPAASNQHPAATTQHPAASNQHPAASNQHPAATTQHPAATTRHPAATTQHPAATTQHPDYPTASDSVQTVTHQKQARQLRLLSALVRQPKCTLLLEDVPVNQAEWRGRQEEEVIPLVLAISSCLFPLVEQQQHYQLLLDYLCCLSSTEVRPVLGTCRVFVAECMLETAVDLIMTGWTAPGCRNTPEQLRSCLAELMAVAQVVGAEGSLETGLVGHVGLLSWSSSPRLHTLAGLGRCLGADHLLHLCPQLVDGLILAIAGNHLLHVAAELFALVAQVMSDERLTDMLVTAIDVGGSDECPVRRRAINTHWLPVLVKQRHSVAVCLLDRLLGPTEPKVTSNETDGLFCGVLTAGNRVRVCAGLCLLHELVSNQQEQRVDARLAALQQRLLSEHRSILSAALTSWWSECRCAGMQALCSLVLSAAKAFSIPSVLPRVSHSSEPPQVSDNAFTIDCSDERKQLWLRVWRALSHALATECALTRHTLVSQLRRLLLPLQPPRTSLSPPPTHIFRRWSSTLPGLFELVSSVCKLLTPHANYASVNNCLLVLQRTIPIIKQCVSCEDPQLDVAGLAREVSERLLLLCMSTSSEEVGVRAGSLWLQLADLHRFQGRFAATLEDQLRAMTSHLAGVPDPRRSLCAANLSRLLVAITSDLDVGQLVSPHLAVCKQLLGDNGPVYSGIQQSSAMPVVVDISRPLHGHIACLRVITCEASNTGALADHGINGKGDGSVESNPIYLLLECVRTVCAVIDATLMSLSHWTINDDNDRVSQNDDDQLFDYTSPSFADIGARLDSLASAVTTCDTCQSDPSTDIQRRLLAHYWLNLKECCRFVSEYANTHIATADRCDVCNAGWTLHAQSSTDSDGSDLHSRFCRLSPLPRLVLCVRRVLTNCRHKGAIEAARLAWSRLCAAVVLVSAREGIADGLDPWSLFVLPELERVICLVERDRWDEGRDGGGQKRSCSLTRRGAGLPILLVCILSTSWRGQQQLVDSAVNRLLTVVRRPLPPVDSSDGDRQITADLAQTDAVYMINAIVVGGLSCDLQAVALAALKGLLSPLWPIRNASSVLFASLLPRLIGQKKSRTRDQLNSCSLMEFSGRWPRLITPLVQNVLLAAGKGSSADSPLAAALLTLIGRLTSPGPTASLRAPIKRLMLSSRHWATRRLAARALASLLTSDEREKELAEGGAEFVEAIGGESSARGRNRMHGYLLFARASLAMEEQPTACLHRAVARICWQAAGSASVCLACPPVATLALHLIADHPEVAGDLAVQMHQTRRSGDVDGIAAVASGVLKVLLCVNSSRLAEQIEGSSDGLCNSRFFLACSPYSEQLLRVCAGLAMLGPRSRDCLLELIQQHTSCSFLGSLILSETVEFWLSRRRDSDCSLSADWVALCCRCVSAYCIGLSACNLSAGRVAALLKVCVIHWQLSAVVDLKSSLLELWHGDDGSCTDLLRPELLSPLVQLSVAPFSCRSTLSTMVIGPCLDHPHSLSMLDRVTGAFLTWSGSDHSDVELRLAAASSVGYLWSVVSVAVQSDWFRAPDLDATDVSCVVNTAVLSVLFRASVRVLAASVCLLTDEEFDVREGARAGLAGAAVICDSDSSEPPLVTRWSRLLRCCLLRWREYSCHDTGADWLTSLHAYLDAVLIGLMLPSPFPATILSAAWAGLANGIVHRSSAEVVHTVQNSTHSVSLNTADTTQCNQREMSFTKFCDSGDRHDDDVACRIARSVCSPSVPLTPVCDRPSAGDISVMTALRGCSDVSSDWCSEIDGCLRASLFSSCVGSGEVAIVTSSLPPVYRQQLCLARACASSLSRDWPLTADLQDLRGCLLGRVLVCYWQRGLWLRQLQKAEDTSLLFHLLLWEGVYSVLGCFRLLLQQLLDLQEAQGSEYIGLVRHGNRSNEDCCCSHVTGWQSVTLWRETATVMDSLLERCPLLPKLLS